MTCYQITYLLRGLPCTTVCLWDRVDAAWSTLSAQGATLVSLVGGVAP